MKNKALLLILSAICFGPLFADPASDYSKKDGKYTFGDKEIDPSDPAHGGDWSNPSVIEWCSRVSALKMNCLRLMPEEAKIVEVEGKKLLSIPIRAHLWFSDFGSGTAYYYGEFRYNPENLEMQVTLDDSKTTQTAVIGWSTGFGEAKDYREKMEEHLKKYFEGSAFIKKMLETRPSLQVHIEKILKK